MTALRLEPRYGRALDLALAAVEHLSLARCVDGTFAEAPSPADRLERALAFAGIDATPAVVSGIAPSAVRVRCAGLAAVPRRLVLMDVVRIQRVPLGIATAHVMRRRFSRLRPPSADAVRRCTRLLRGENALLSWTREAWIRREDLRDLRRFCPVRLAPSGAASAPPRARLAWASEGLFARWAFA